LRGGYLAAVLDWLARRVLAWRVSITLDVDFCIEAVEEALARYGTPEIFNTGVQGSQFTSSDFIKMLAANEIKISMDGNGSAVYAYKPLYPVFVLGFAPARQSDQALAGRSINALATTPGSLR